MSRDPNDDRSDTMNPNNDAYWADQENRFGGDDEDGDASSSAAADYAVAAVRPREVSLNPADRPWSPRYTERQRCGPIVIDRASHFLWAVEQIANCVVGHMVESAQSAERRAAHLVELRALAGDIGAAERSGRYGAEFRERDAHRAEGSGQVDRSRLALYEDAVLASIGWVGTFGYTPLLISGPDASPRPELVAVGWRTGLDLLGRSLARGLEDAGILDGGPRKDTAVVYATNEESSWRSVEPGVFGFEAFPSEDDMYAWELGLDRHPTLPMASCPSRGYGGEWSYSLPGLSIFPMLFPGSGSSVGASLTAAACGRLFAALQWLVDPFADWWDIRPTIAAARRAAAEAEWAGLSHAVFGVRVERQRHEREGSEAASVTTCARSREDAAAQAAAVSRRGYRTVVLQTRPASGRAPWLLPIRRDGHEDLKLAGSEEFWLVDGTRGRKAGWHDADSWVRRIWPRW